MNWSDRALVLGCRGLGESAVILEAMTREHGRHLGLVHGGRSRQMRPVLQPGNSVVATWRARLDEQLGTFQVEGDVARAARLMTSPVALLVVATIASHLRLLAERDPYPELFDATEALLDRLDGADAPASFARFELALLAELGFGLDLGACAATGESHDLAYVSPKTGRAVGRVAGDPYRSRLLPLPAFLVSDGSKAEPGAVADAFRLTGYFLEAYLYGPRTLALPDERARLLALVGRVRAAPGSDNLGDRGGAETDSVGNGTA